MNIVSAKYADAEQTAIVVNDNVSVPVNSSNRHYVEVQKWVAEGNTIEPYVAPPAPVPAAISKLQLKYALGADWPTVKAYIDADPSLLEDWNLASEIHRASTLVNTAAAALGYTPEQMDDIFRAGAGIAV